MNPNPLQQTLLDLASRTMELGVNWLLQSTLLIAAGLTIGYLLRSRGSAVQSAVYRTTLVAALVCPLATWVLSLVGATGWSMAMPAAYEVLATGGSPVPEATTEQVVDSTDLRPSSFQPPQSPVARDPIPFDAEYELPVPTVESDTNPLEQPIPVTSDDLPAAVATAEPPVTTATDTEQLRVLRFGAVAVAFAAVWIAATFLLLGRLAWAWRRLAELRRHASLAEEATLRECNELATRMNVCAPEVLHSPFLPSPCLAGLRRPAVLLPDGTPDLPVRDVLIHALAHLVRHDCHWNLLRRAATGAFFFQPLLWKLSQRLQATAEEVCDDYVVSFGGNRHDYAHRLVDLAELSVAPMAAAGVGIVSFRSMLARRVTRILDSSRSLSTRAGHAMLALVLIGGLFATMLAGLVGIGPREGVVEAEAVEEVVVEESEDEDLITVRGTVVNPNGKPVAGADVYALRWYWDFGERKPLSQVKTDESGRFEISYRKSQFLEDAGRPDQWREVYIAAFNDGYGPNWADYDELAPGEEPTIQLAKDDVSIEGRIVDLEGNPVAGVTIEIGTIYRSNGDNLDEWLELVRAGQTPQSTHKALDGSMPVSSTELWPIITTDADGHFRLTGIGRERLVSFHVKGSTIVTNSLRVATRQMEPVSQPAFTFPGTHNLTNYGARFEYAAAPSRPIEGVVRDAETGEPIAGVGIWSDKFAGENISGYNIIKVESDENGRYRLEGMPKGEGNEILVVPIDQPYFTAEFDVPDPVGIEPVQLDIELHRGVWVTGRVTDKVTGKGVGARMHYIVCPDNPLAAELPEFVERTHVMRVQDRYRTDADGQYRVVALPGRGIIGVNAFLDPYPSGQGYDDISDLADRDSYRKYNGVFAPTKKSPTAIKEVHVHEKPEKVICDFVLDPGRRVALHVLDSSGVPLKNVSVTGSRGLHGNRREMPEAQFDILALRDDETRTVLLHHEERGLGKALRVKAGDGKNGPIVVQLEPCATVSGRLIDDLGEPVQGVSLRFGVSGDGDYGRSLRSSATDGEGRFHHDAVLPGLAYNILAEGATIEFAQVASKLDVRPGETIDLGTIDVTSEERPKPVRMKVDAASKPERNSGDEEGDNQITVRGTVVDPDGKPLAGATVKAIRVKTTQISWDSTQEVAGQTTSRSDGTYEIQVHRTPKEELGASRFVRQHIVLLADAPGLAPDFESPGAVRRDEPIELQLAEPGAALEGRVMDIEGQPVAGARVKVRAIAIAHRDRDLNEWIKKAQQNPRSISDEMRTAINRRASNRPQIARFPSERTLDIEGLSLVPEVVTGSDGRFRFTGLGADRRIMMQIDGRSIAKGWVNAVTREMEPVPDPQTDPRFAAQVCFGAKIEYVAAPTQVISGIVRDADTGQPLPRLQVVVHQFKESLLGVEGFVSAVTDDSGHYELVGLPKPNDDGRPIKLRVIPDEESPYFRTEAEVPKTDGLGATRCDIDLKQAVWLTGRVTNSETGEPLQAFVSYYPFLDNDSARDYANFDPGMHSMGYGDRYPTTASGTYRIPAIPGRGVVLAIALEGHRYQIGAGADTIDNLRSDRRTSVYHLWSAELANAIREVTIAEGAEEPSADIEIVPLRASLFQLRDPADEPLSGAIVVGQYPQSAFAPSEHLTNLPLDSGRVSIFGLDHDQQRLVMFVHKDKRLGTAQVLTPETPGPIRLQACATITGRLTNGEQPIDSEAYASAYIPKSESPEPKGGRDWGRRNLWVQTDKVDHEGRFVLDRIVPGVRYQIRAMDVTHEMGVVQSGETIDLGTIDVTSEERPEPVRTEAADSTTKTPADSDRETVVEYTGNVVTPEGEPAAQARLFLVYHVNLPDDSLTPTWKPIGTTDAAGNFRIALVAKDLPGNEREWSAASLVATVDGFGFAWTSAAMHEASGKYLAKYRERLNEAPPEMRTHLEKTLAQAGQPLHLTRDNEPIRGRILDIDGQPVAGARLTLLEVWAGAEDELTPWLEATKAERADYYSARSKTPRMINGPQVRSLVTPAVTDANGRFTLRGIGRERIAELLVTGPDIQWEKIFARTRTGESIELLKEWRSPDLGKFTYYPAKFTYVAGPSRPIVGLVRDRSTKEPLAGVLIKSQHRHGNPISGWGQDFVRAKSGADGRYRLEGMPIGDENRIAAIAGSDRAYLPMSKSADTGAGDSEIEVNFDLPPVVWVEGQVTDKQTGEGLPGWVHYYIYADNPSLDEIGRPGMVDLRDRYQANDEGRFRIPVLPGGGVIGFSAFDHQKYPRAVGAMSIKGATRADGREIIRTEPSHLVPSNYHVVAEINPATDASRVELNLELDSGGSVKGHVVDPEGKPVTGYYYSGRLAKFATCDMASGDAFEVVGYDAKQPRSIYFAHPERNLAGSYTVRGNPPQNLTVKLQPAGKVTGRIVGDDGEALGNLMLRAWQPSSFGNTPAMAKNNAETQAPLPPNRQNQSQWVTDDEGRFTIESLVPGMEYRLKVIDRESMSRRFPPARMPRVDGGLERAIVVEPGETLELGGVRVVDDAKFETAATSKDGNSNAKGIKSSPKQSEETNASATGMEIQGAITGADGKPLAGANVAVIGMKNAVSRGGDFDAYRSQTFAQETTDSNGRYRMVVDGLSSKTHQQVATIASAEGLAVAWEQLNPDAESAEVSFELQSEKIIKGRLVDLEGQPAADVRVSIQSVIVAVKNGDVYIPRDGVGFRGSDDPPPAWMQPVTTDADGHFAIHNIASNHGVFLEVEGDERFAPQDISLNTGMPEQRGERDGTYRSLVKNITPGEEAVLPLAPAQIFEGVVRYEDTGEPAPHARLTIWASQQSVGGSMIAVAGKVDAQGRYRISPKPGIRFGGTAYPPDGAPYLTRKLPEMRWEGGDTRKQIDVALPRGILVRGKVVESKTNSPVAQASIQYVPESTNNRNAKDDILTGWQGIQLSNEQGEFGIVVLPGPGRLLVHGPQGEYVLKEISSRELNSGQPGGQRNYANAIERLEPEPGAGPIDVRIEIERGEKVTGRIVDESGQPVDRALVITSLKIDPASIWWRGFPIEAMGGEFELSGLASEQEYEVYFLDPERRLGATVMLSTGMEPPVVELQPCGQATARLVNQEGQPLQDFRGSLRMVVTPGAPRYNFDAVKRGELAANSDFVSNIDRTNHWNLSTDDDGQITFPALIPGATYRYTKIVDGKSNVAKEFSVRPGETFDLGEIEIDVND